MATLVECPITRRLPGDYQDSELSGYLAVPTEDHLRIAGVQPYIWLSAFRGVHHWDIMRAIMGREYPILPSLMYDCPFIPGNRYHRFWPTALFTSRSEVWARLPSMSGNVFRETTPEGMASAATFLREDGEYPPAFRTPGIGIVLMGHGFDHTLPGDGSPERVPAVLQLNNGDAIAGLTWVFYHK